jgi:hypothetical protein
MVGIGKEKRKGKGKEKARILADVVGKNADKMMKNLPGM